MFEGQLKEGRPLEGTIQYKDGGSYQGTFRDMREEGFGLHKKVDGSFYEGSFKRGQYHGMGTLTFASGGTIRGYFSQGKPSGFIKLALDSSISLMGTFVDGMAHGVFHLNWKDGSLYRVVLHKNNTDIKESAREMSCDNNLKL